MRQYHDLLLHILDKGIDKGDRTGTGTRSVFGHQMRFDLTQGFPLLTTKKLFFKGIVHELLWFLKGDTNIKYLTDNGVHIWDEWADENGDLGPVYGKQWRSWPRIEACNSPKPKSSVNHEDTTVDQIATVIEQLRKSPDSRRMIVSAWNPSEVDDMALPPCHCLFQFYTRPMTLMDRFVEYNRRVGGAGFEYEGNEELIKDVCDEDGIPTRFLDCQLYQRSADVFLGVPFNIASYALLTHMIAQVVDMVPGEFIHTLGDAHIYSNHMQQVEQILSRSPRRLPDLWLSHSVNEIDAFTFNDISLENYDPMPAIKAPVAV